MVRGAWWATVHTIAESTVPEQLNTVRALVPRAQGSKATCSLRLAQRTLLLGRSALTESLWQPGGPCGGPRGSRREARVPASCIWEVPQGLGVGQQGRPTCPPGPSRPSGTLYFQAPPVSQRPLWVLRGQLLWVGPSCPAPAPTSQHRTGWEVPVE